MSWVSQVRSAGSRLFDIDLIPRRHLSEKRESERREVCACMEGLFLPSLKSIIVVPVAFRGDDDGACLRAPFVQGRSRDIGPCTPSSVPSFPLVPLSRVQYTPLHARCDFIGSRTLLHH